MGLPLLAELKRRRVFRALVGYGIAAFAVLQIIEPVMHGFHWPDSVLSYVVAALAVGFPIVVTLAWIFDVNQGRIERTAGGPVGARLAALLIAIGLAAAAPGVGWYFFVRGVARAPSAQPAPSIAVLPFVDMSAQKDQEYFSDGVAEEILNALAQVEGLRVAGRTSSFSFKGKNEDLRSIGEKLMVATVLEGSVRKEGSRVRITAQLVSAADGFHLWSQTFDREMKGIFAAQDEIARAVVEALKPRLVREPPARRPASSPEAYNEYLIGKQLMYRLTLDDYRRAEAAFQRAIAHDAIYAPAWAWLAFARFWIADGADSVQAISQGFDQAVAAAEKAVALDPELAEGYAVRGFLRASVGSDWRGAESDFQKALALNPGDAETHRRHAQMELASVGKLKEAIAEAKMATELDPLSPITWSTLGRLYYSDGQLDAAQASIERSVQIKPDQNYAPAHLAFIFVLQHRPADALPALEHCTSGVFRLQGQAFALHDLGRAQEAQRALDELIQRYGSSAAYQIGSIYAWFGDRDRAFEWLARAYEQRDAGMHGLKFDVPFRNLRGDPRFAALLAKMNLPVE
jgi:TolB-like protein/Tfp pilus assembly protein PilF